MQTEAGYFYDGSSVYLSYIGTDCRRKRSGAFPIERNRDRDRDNDRDADRDRDEGRFDKRRLDGVNSAYEGWNHHRHHHNQSTR